MPNRGIFGNAVMHKNYLKTKAFIQKKADSCGKT